MLQRHPTVDELVSTLRRSKLPTVVVEGRDDMQIFRWMEDLLEVHEIDILAAGMRSNVLAVYERKSEFAHLPVVFIADRDKELFTQLPEDYEEIIWTKGYSIENDLYAGAEPSLENLMDPNETDEHRQLLDTIVKWFAFEVEEFSHGRQAKVGRKLKDIIPRGQTEMDEDYRANRGFRIPRVEFISMIKEEYQLRLRGKFLFEMLARFLADNSRAPSYSLFSLYEIAFKIPNPHPWRDRLIREVEQILDKQQRKLM